MDHFRLLTSKQAATILGIAEGTLQQWRTTRRIDGPPFIKIGRAVRYRSSDIERFIQERVVQSDRGDDRDGGQR